MTAQQRVDESEAQQAMAAREELVEGNFDQVVAGYKHARGQGERDPVVFLVDCEDTIGSEIARAWEGDEAVDEAILEARHAGPTASEDPAADSSPTADASPAVESPTTILVRTFPFADCRQEIPGVFPYLADSFHEPPADDQFLIVVIAAAGAATFTAPIA